MTQLNLPFAGQQEAAAARHYASVGNVTMCNIYLHKWACETGGDGVDGFVIDLRKMAAGNCLEPEAIGDPALFV